MAKKITFKETGIEAPEEERLAIMPGMSFSVTAVRVKKSANYGEIIHIDGFDLEGHEQKYYTTSGVLKSQALEMLSRFGRPGDKDGVLTTEILVTVEAKRSSNGRTFHSFA